MSVIFIIHVFDNDDVDTGIWHKGSDPDALIRKAEESLSDVYGLSMVPFHTTPRSGGFAATDGQTYRYEIGLNR